MTLLIKGKSWLVTEVEKDNDLPIAYVKAIHENVFCKFALYPFPVRDPPLADRTT